MFPETLDQAIAIETCFSALQSAAGDHLSFVLIDDYSRLFSIIANDIQFPYYIIAANQSAEESTTTLLNIIQRYGNILICKFVKDLIQCGYWAYIGIR